MRFQACRIGQVCRLRQKDKVLAWRNASLECPPSRAGPGSHASPSQSQGLFRKGRTMHNNRAPSRLKSGIDGKVIAPSSSLWADCRILDMSESGAVVAAIVPDPAPERLYLWQASTSVLFECNVIWQRSGTLGLRFTDPLARAPTRASLGTAALVPYSASRLRSSNENGRTMGAAASA
jgi:hypothetical protein